jgi:integrase/recombinase XerD
MTTATPSTALATIQPAFTDAERLALAGFLAGYRGLTREAYALDLRQFTTWCRVRSLALFAVRRADIESFARELEARGRARAAVTRRLSTIAGLFRYAVEEELLDHSPAAHVRRPRVDYESHAAALDRNELGALLIAAGLGSPPEHALISLLALTGLRVSEATGADIEHLGLERGHRTLLITRRGGKVVTIPVAPRTARAIDLSIGERAGGPAFLAADGRRLDRHGAGRIVRRTARRAGIGNVVTPHTLRHAFITAALDAGVPLRDVQEAASRADPRTTMRYDRARAAWTGTLPISSQPTSQAPPGNTPPGISFARRPPARRSWADRFAVVTHCDLGASGNRRSARLPRRQRDLPCRAMNGHSARPRAKVRGHPSGEGLTVARQRPQAAGHPGDLSPRVRSRWPLEA